MIVSIFTTGYSLRDEILLVGVRSHTGEYRLFPSAAEFIDYFLRTDDKIVVGFNVLKWDLPFLMVKHSGAERFEEFFRKVNYSNVVDLFAVLTFQNRGAIKSLDFHLEKNGIAKDFPTDPEISRLLATDRKKAEEAVRKKLDAINSLYWRLKG